MTIHEAAATLGLEPNQLSLDAVQRNYRLKVKQCHPDLASHPGAANEFKRATSAFNTLLAYLQEPSQQESTDEALDRAAQEFQFIAWFEGSELWGSMSLLEKARAITGVRIRPVDLREVPQDLPLVIRTFGSRIKELNPLLIAPVDVEILADRQREDQGYEMLLRPLDTDCVREWLAEATADGTSLESACRNLAIELSTASRAPLRGSKQQRRVA